MTEAERTLDFLIRTAEAIAATFGSSCETLVHDMSKPGHPLVAIFNAQVSGRGIGSTADIFGNDHGAGNSPEYIKDDAVNTLAITKSGRCIKSTTTHYKGKGYHYALGINYDYTSLLPLTGILQDLTTTAISLDEQLTKSGQLQLDKVFNECLSSIGKPIGEMKKADKLRLMELLMNTQIFELQKSVTYVAERLNVSRYTIYKYMKELKQD